MMLNRTRRKDIQDFCIRRTHTLESDFTDQQRELHDALLTFEVAALSKLHGGPWRQIYDVNDSPSGRKLHLWTCSAHPGFRVEQIDGSVKNDDRLDFRARFELPKDDPEAIDIMLFTEVGSEGLDYQFCDMMINYDLPWNPMRIEQRIVVSTAEAKGTKL